MRHISLPGRQRGVVMFVALIMMVLMLLVAVSSFNMGRHNTVIAGNMQQKAEAVRSANQAVEEVISRTDFMNTPANALPGGCGTNQACYDVNGDGTDDITVTLNPAPCVKKVLPIKNADLNASNSNDAVCIVGATQSLGVAGSTTGDSLCANMIWEVNAVAADNVTSSAASVATGVAVRVATDSAVNSANICP